MEAEAEAEEDSFYSSSVSLCFGFETFGGWRGGGGAVGFERVEFGFGDVAAAGFEEVVFGIGFGLEAVDPKVAGFDAERAELVRKPEVGDWFSFELGSPGAVKAIIEFLHKIASEKAVHLSFEEDDVDIQQEGADGAVVAGRGAQVKGGLAGEIGPGAAGEVGQGEERFPDVGGAVVQAVGEIRASGGDGAGMIQNEARALTLQSEGLKVTQAFALFVRGFALDANDDAAVGESVRQGTDLADDFGAPAGEEREGRGWTGGVVELWSGGMD